MTCLMIYKKVHRVLGIKFFAGEEGGTDMRQADVWVHMLCVTYAT